MIEKIKALDPQWLKAGGAVAGILVGTAAVLIALGVQEEPFEDLEVEEEPKTE
jgi:hypothetical protein